MRAERLVLGMALLAVGCGASRESSPFASADATPDLTDTGRSGTTVDSDPSDTGTDAVPAYWSVDAELVMTSGAVDVSESRWWVRLWTETEQEIPCSFDVPVLAETVEPVSAVTAGTLASWWMLTLGAVPATASCPAWPASVVGAGFGPYDERLDAASDAHEWLALDLYGFYVQIDPSSPILVVGVAGTADQFAGVDTVATGVLLPDGTYSAHTLVLLAL